MTDRPFGMLAPSDYLRHIRSAADGFVAAVAEGPTDVVVPSCPGWSLHQLVEHLGRVHQWVSGMVATGDAPKEELVGPADGEDLVAWYGRHARGLLDALVSAGPERPCGTHQPDNQRGLYWFRRQALETAMHRVDAELARGLPASYDRELAADGIGEVLDVWIPKITEVVKAPEVAAPVLLACADRPERWLISPDPAGLGRCPVLEGPSVDQSQAGTAAATVTGKTEDLLFVLWKRRQLDERVRLGGEVGAARRFLASTLTP